MDHAPGTSRLYYLAVAACLGTAARSQPAPAQEQERPPNIVLILADDLGYGDLGCYGALDLRTPHLDALAAAGIRFDRFYANSSVCSPTRAALLSGRYPDLVGVQGVIRTRAEENWGYLSPRALLLPEILKQAGYHSALVGKWHLGLESPNTPGERGFDLFHGFLGDMMEDYYRHRRHGLNYLRLNDETIDPEGHATDLFTEWAIDFLKDQRDARKPFFLYLAFNAPHMPLQPPPEWLERVKKREPQMKDERAKLAALIEHMDDGIGRVLAALKGNNQSENTLIIFTSDNGGQLAAGASTGGLRGGKGDLYEGGIRVPMFAAWPGRIHAGARSERVALAMDLFPAICEAAGVKIDHPIDGVSILPALLGRDDPPPGRDLFWVRREGGPGYYGQDHYAVRRGDWKLLQNRPFEPLQLFNLKDDPREERDLASQEAKITAELSEALRAHHQRAGAVPWQKP